MIKNQKLDTTIIKYPNTDGHLLQNLNIKCTDRNNSGKKQNFIKSTKTASPSDRLKLRNMIRK